MLTLSEMYTLVVKIHGGQYIEGRHLNKHQISPAALFISYLNYDISMDYVTACLSCPARKEEAARAREEYNKRFPSDID
jgi:hypothetical protein